MACMQIPQPCASPCVRRHFQPSDLFTSGFPYFGCNYVCSKASKGQPGPVAIGPVALSQLRWEQRTPLGRLLIRPIERADVQAASVVLTRAFASSAEAVPLAEVLKDIDSMLLAYPGPTSDFSSDPSTISRGVTADGYFLVARLYPSDLQQAPLPPGQDSRLVGTASISISVESQPVRRLPLVNLPPSGGAYVSNMAVDPRVRRRGVARALLQVCEELACSAGRQDVWLHVREADAAARALYNSAGYVAAAKDSWLDTMKHGGMQPRILMRKELRGELS